MYRSTYIIRYTVYHKNGTPIKEDGVMNCHNRTSEMEAKVKLEEYLIKKYPAFGRLVVHSCVEDIFGTSKRNTVNDDVFYKDDH
jgi:hypothetical protein